MLIVSYCTNWSMRCNQKVPVIIWRWRFCVPLVLTARIECYWSFVCASFTKVASSEEAARQVAGRDNSFEITIAYQVTHRLLCSNSCYHWATALSASRSEWLLAIPYSENLPKGDTFWNHGGHQIECNGRPPEGSQTSLPTVLPTRTGSMKHVCVRKGPTLRVIMKAFPYVLPLKCNTTSPGTYWLPIIFHFPKKCNSLLEILTILIQRIMQFHISVVIFRSK
jgi:hypothetical protein